MPKFKKEAEKTVKKKKKRRSDDDFAFRSVLFSAILGGVFLIISLILNGTEFFFEGILLHILDEEITYEAADAFEGTFSVSETIDNAIKAVVILLSFFFIYISIGNYKELTGKPATLKEGMFLVGLALVQTIRIGWVFLFTLIGLVVILVYLYLVQEN